MIEFLANSTIHTEIIDNIGELIDRIEKLIYASILSRWSCSFSSVASSMLYGLQEREEEKSVNDPPESFITAIIWQNMIFDQLMKEKSTERFLAFFKEQLANQIEENMIFELLLKTYFTHYGALKFKSDFQMVSSAFPNHKFSKALSCIKVLLMETTSIDFQKIIHIKSEFDKFISKNQLDPEISGELYFEIVQSKRKIV